MVHDPNIGWYVVAFVAPIVYFIATRLAKIEPPEPIDWLAGIACLIELVLLLLSLANHGKIME